MIPLQFVRKGQFRLEWGDKSVLITGGTGTLGCKLVEYLLLQKPKRLIVFSRDEWKHAEMRQRWPDSSGSPIRYFIGDVRDKERLCRAFQGVDIVIHTAALKRIEACEYNSQEAAKTNITGSQNVIDAALDCGVSKAILISSDKACQSLNLYGATKRVAEALFVQANSYSGRDGTKFAVVRYGNVVGSRGSVVPIFLKQRETGVLNITDPRMTRFWITLDQAVALITTALDRMHGGEVWIPRIPSMFVSDLAKAIGPDCEQRVIGIQPGEKLAELLISEDESRQVLDCGDVYLVQPSHPFWQVGVHKGKPVPEGWRYASNVNTDWLTVDDLRALLKVGAAGA